MSVFSGVWLYSAVAFVIGVLLTWLAWVRPLQKRLARARSEGARPVPEDGAPTLFQPGATEAETAPAGTTGTLSGLLTRPDPYGDFSPNFDARPDTGEPATTLMEPIPAEFRRSVPATRDDHPGSAEVEDRAGTLPSDTTETRSEQEPVRTGEFEPVEAEGDVERWRAEPTWEVTDDDGEPDRATAYFAHLAREQEAPGEDGNTVPAEPDTDDEPPEDRHEDGGDPFFPVHRYGEYGDHADWYRDGRVAGEVPDLPEIPDVGGDDLTPFDAFTPGADEREEYAVPTNGTAELDYLTLPEDDAAADGTTAEQADGYPSYEDWADDDWTDEDRPGDGRATKDWTEGHWTEEDWAEEDRSEVERSEGGPADVDRAEMDQAEIDRAEIDQAEVDRAEVDRAEADRAEEALADEDGPDLSADDDGAGDLPADELPAADPAHDTTETSTRDRDTTPAAPETAPLPERSLFEPVVAPEPFGDDEEEGAEPTRPAGHDDTQRVPAVDRPPEAEPVRDGPFGPGSALPRVDGGAPSPEFTVKARTSSMVFHTPGSPFFDRLLPQVWFRTAEDAKRAGFTSWERPER